MRGKLAVGARHQQSWRQMQNLIVAVPLRIVILGLTLVEPGLYKKPGFLARRSSRGTA
ncbi:hypothetical protein [Microseira wollei]|uniref:hypothetical protein n=1 Tax=Microseira wollei TaxID=467598 RepID=UPI001CFF2C0B|nr:hypothetical protein [Microseira wollei]